MLYKLLKTAQKNLFIQKQLILFLNKNVHYSSNMFSLEQVYIITLQII